MAPTLALSLSMVRTCPVETIVQGSRMGGAQPCLRSQFMCLHSSSAYVSGPCAYVLAMLTLMVYVLVFWLCLCEWFMCSCSGCAYINGLCAYVLAVLTFLIHVLMSRLNLRPQLPPAQAVVNRWEPLTLTLTRLS